MKKKKRQTSVQHPWLGIMVEYLYILIGSAIVAFSFNVFLLPNKIASGGVSGISTILHISLGVGTCLCAMGF